MRFLAPLLLLAMMTSGCAAGTDEDADRSPAAATTGSAYDVVEREGRKVVTDKTVTDDRSASTHLVMFVAGAPPETLAKALSSLGRWSEITALGKPMFGVSEAASETTSNGVRSVKATLTMSGVTANLVATSRADDDGFQVTVSNTSPIKKLFTIAETGKLKLEAKLVRRARGTVVDATMTVKTPSMFDSNAPEFTEMIVSIADWLEKTPPEKAGAK